MRADFDLAVLGSGFAGSLLAMVARRLGLRVLLLERGSHPRFVIGESTSPLTNLLLEELVQEYDLPRLLPLASYGAWKGAYPEVGVGLKRGFSFYHHRPGDPFRPDPERRNELLVAASPNDEVADTHWYRPDFDHFLVREAQALGVDYLDRVRITGYTRAGEATTLTGERAGSAVRYTAAFVADASGPRGALHGLLGLVERPLSPTFPRTQALFTHFTGAPRFAPHTAAAQGTPPYPPDDAALHHVFPGGWVWVLRFENGITSAGVAAEDTLANELRFAEGAPAWARFLDRFPGIRAHLDEAAPVLPFCHFPAVSFRSGTITGPGFALLPSAAGFVDPLFSTGFPLALLGIRRLAEALRTGFTAWSATEYSEATQIELDATAHLVAACYRHFNRFADFAALSMLYFAAASYAELARRLDRPGLAARFLLQDQEPFRALFQRHCAAEGVDAAALARDLTPFNVAGLCDPCKRNWYGVDPEDVVRGAERLHARPEEVRALFARMGFAATT